MRPLTRHILAIFIALCPFIVLGTLSLAPKFIVTIIVGIVLAGLTGMLYYASLMLIDVFEDK